MVTPEILEAYVSKFNSIKAIREKNKRLVGEKRQRQEELTKEGLTPVKEDEGEATWPENDKIDQEKEESPSAKKSQKLTQENE